LSSKGSEISNFFKLLTICYLYLPLTLQSTDWINFKCDKLFNISIDLASKNRHEITFIIILRKHYDVFNKVPVTNCNFYFRTYVLRNSSSCYDRH